MEFDKKKFDILRHAQPDGVGYINDGLAVKMMEDGLLKKSPRKVWHISGHKTTKKGTILFKAWLKEIRDKHGHQWMKHSDSEEFEGKKDKYSEKLDDFAYSEGYHNGYKCKKCGFVFCHHCYHESDIPKCSKYSKGKTMSDNSKIVFPL